mmetsp:Transcript_33961/g.81634  ORF Transcript_33961/g.81634 Transcript_33961/m.81634 type:complete len:216 (+) Transcript_33961:136-783(+)
MTGSATLKNLYVVSVDCRPRSGRGAPSVSDIRNYKEEKCDPTFFQTKIVDNPKIKCHSNCEIAKLCGIGIGKASRSGGGGGVKIYFAKAKVGLGQHFKRGGPGQAMMTLQRDPSILSNNNGIASWLTVDVVNGLPTWTVGSKAYVVCDDGTTPISKEQVWCMVDMVQESMEIYDFEPENMVAGKQLLTDYGQRYQSKTYSSSTDPTIDVYKQRDP